MRSRKHWKKEAEAKFLANIFRELAGFAQKSGFPVAAHLMGMAEFDIAQQALLPEYLNFLEAQGLACRWPPLTPESASPESRDEGQN